MAIVEIWVWLYIPCNSVVTLLSRLEYELWGVSTRLVVRLELRRSSMTSGSWSSKLDQVKHAQKSTGIHTNGGFMYQLGHLLHTVPHFQNVSSGTDCAEFATRAPLTDYILINPCSLLTSWNFLPESATFDASTLKSCYLITWSLALSDRRYCRMLRWMRF